MHVDEAIRTLCSIRRFRDDPVPEEHVREIVELALRAPMPSREQVWRVLAVTDRDLVGRMRGAVEERLDEMSRWSTHNRSRGQAAERYFGAIFPEQVTRSRDPYEKMKAYSLFFDQAPVVLVLTVAGLEWTRVRMLMKKGFMGRPGRPGPGGRPGGPSGEMPGGVRWAFRYLLSALSASLRRRLAGRRQPAPRGTHDHLGEARPDLQSLGAAVQNLALAAHARGYGVCWMTAPLLAADRLEQMLDLEAPWRLAALLPLGVPAESPSPRPRPDLDDVLSFRRPPGGVSDGPSGAAPAGGSG